jgi:predicted nucleotidyltransferase
MIDIGKIKPDIERICRGLPVKRLGLFGSAVREDFSEGSDVDVLVMFDLAESADLFNSYFDLKEQLEAVFRREVDLVVDKRFKNPVLRESIDRTRVVVYERGHKEESH